MAGDGVEIALLPAGSALVGAERLPGDDGSKNCYFTPEQIKDYVASVLGQLASLNSADNAHLANMATKTIKGRTSAGTGAPEDLTAAQAKAIVDVGTTTNDNATAGHIGEYIESVVASGSAVSLTTGTAKTVTSISLTPGDWDVSGVVSLLPAASTSVTRRSASISLTADTLGANGAQTIQPVAAVVTGATSFSLPTPTVRVSIAVTTIVYLIGFADFTVSTMAAFGAIRARRMR